MCVAFPEWQDNFVFCFVTKSALTKHSAMTIEYFNYQAEEGCSCKCRLQGKRKRELILKDDDVSDGAPAVSSKIISLRNHLSSVLCTWVPRGPWWHHKAQVGHTHLLLCTALPSIGLLSTYY